MPIEWRLGFCLEGVKTGQGAVNPVPCQNRAALLVASKSAFLKKKKTKTKKLVQNNLIFNFKKRNAQSH